MLRLYSLRYHTSKSPQGFALNDKAVSYSSMESSRNSWLRCKTPKRNGMLGDCKKHGSRNQVHTETQTRILQYTLGIYSYLEAEFTVVVPFRQDRSYCCSTCFYDNPSPGIVRTSLTEGSGRVLLDYSTIHTLPRVQ